MIVGDELPHGRPKVVLAEQDDAIETLRLDRSEKSLRGHWRSVPGTLPPPETVQRTHVLLGDLQKPFGRASE
jgi:hypothetical protein